MTLQDLEILRLQTMIALDVNAHRAVAGMTSPETWRNQDALKGMNDISRRIQGHFDALKELVSE